jgi:hypothetical protein
MLGVWVHADQPRMDSCDSDPMPRRRYNQAGLPLGESSVPAQTYGPEQAVPIPERAEQGVLPVIPLGPLFDGAEKVKGP